MGRAKRETHHFPVLAAKQWVSLRSTHPTLADAQANAALSRGLDF
jgi:hypothetical protein